MDQLIHEKLETGEHRLVWGSKSCLVNYESPGSWRWKFLEGDIPPEHLLPKTLDSLKKCKDIFTAWCTGSDKSAPTASSEKKERIRVIYKECEYEAVMIAPGVAEILTDRRVGIRPKRVV